MTDHLITDHIFIWQKDCYKRIALDDIVFIKADRSYSEIVTVKNECFVLSVPLMDIHCKIPDDGRFIRIHRSYVINIRFIDSMMGNMFTTITGVKITIGREYRKNVFMRFIFVGAKRGLFKINSEYTSL